jgi:hypothetical protein
LHWQVKEMKKKHDALCRMRNHLLEVEALAGDVEDAGLGDLFAVDDDDADAAPKAPAPKAHAPVPNLKEVWIEKAVCFNVHVFM